MSCTSSSPSVFRRWINVALLTAGVWAGVIMGATVVANAQGAASDDASPQAVQLQDTSNGDATAAARAQLDQILRDPMFHRWELVQEGKNELEGAWLNAVMDTAARWREQLLEWIRGFLPDMSPSLPHSDGMSGVTGVVFKVLAYMLGVLLLIFVIIVIVRVFRAPTQPAATHILSRKRLHEALQQGHALATDSNQWIHEAMHLAQQNDLRLAYRAMYLALLSGLHQQRDIDFHQQCTNWTYVQQFRGEAESKKTFAGLTEMFDDVWYGQGQPESGKFQRVRLEIDALLTPPSRKEAK